MNGARPRLIERIRLLLVDYHPSPILNNDPAGPLRNEDLRVGGR